MERLFVDTSAWFAFVNASDPDHAPVSAVLREHEGRLVTSNFVFDETVTLCRYRLGHELAARTGAVLRDEIEVVRVTADDERTAWSLFLERDDKRYSFTDCASFVVMRRLGLTVAVAVDDDFRQEGLRTLPES